MQGTLRICSLRVAPQGLVDLTPSLPAVSSFGVWLALQVGGLNFASFIPTPLRFPTCWSSEQASFHACKVDFAARSTDQNFRMVLAFSAFLQFRKPGVHRGWAATSELWSALLQV